MRKRAVFLDRDGVINPYVCHPEFGTVDSPSRAAEFRLIPGVGQAIARLNQMGFLVVVVSNQPGIAKRKFTVAHLQAMTHKMHSLVGTAGGKIDAVYYCCHHPDSILPVYRKSCDCRKPKPGLLTRASREWNIDLPRSYIVGDAATDLLAGHSVGCTSFFLSSRKCYVCDELARSDASPHFLVQELGEVPEALQGLECGNNEFAERFAFRCMVSSK